MLRFPDIFLICDNFTEWYILDYRGLCCCPIVTGLWLYCQRISYHCSAITFDLTCGDCIWLFYRMTLTFIFSQNEKFLLPRKARKFCLPIQYKYCIQLTKIMWKSILYISISSQYVHFLLYNSARDSSYVFPKNSLKFLNNTHTHMHTHIHMHTHSTVCKSSLNHFHTDNKVLKAI